MVFGTSYRLNSGDLIDERYEIIELIGRGGFGQTYLAKDRECSDRLCVVKRLKPRSNHPDVLRAAKDLFHRESQVLLRKLDKHPQIPQLLAYIEQEEKKEFYIVQEYIEGHTLKEEIAEGKRWSEDKVIELLKELLSILQFVHQQQVIHRDIKPSNSIRRKSDGKLVLIDFGAVKEIGTLEMNCRGETTHSMVIGTPGYMPPEQACNNPKYNSDIYAVGMIAIAALTGLNPKNLQLDPQTGEKIWLYSVPGRSMPQVSRPLQEILNNMVRRNYTARYTSAAEVLEALSQISSSPPPSRNWWRWGAVAAVFAFGVVISLRFSRTCSPATGDFFSCGEEIIVKRSAPLLKQQGANKFKTARNRQDYQEAATLFSRSWHEEGLDPETLIYLNNALLEAEGNPAYSIAVVVPTTNTSDNNVDGNLARELLRGVAMAQTQVNLSLSNFHRHLPGADLLKRQGIGGKGLRVIIADDANNRDRAKQTAEALVKQKHILGVVGHHASETSIAAADIYEENNLVLISPGSTSEDLSDDGRAYFFRTVPSTEVHASTIVEYLLESGQTKAALFYNPTSEYSRSFRDEFNEKFINSGGNIVKEFSNLPDRNFNAAKAIEEAKDNKAKVLVLLSDGQTSHSLTNAMEIIKANNGDIPIVGSWSLYLNRTLQEIQQPEAFKNFVLFVPWHHLSSPNRKFAKDSEQLWGGRVSARTALSYDATRSLIEALKRQDKATRIGTWQVLSTDFSADGATGTIEFEGNGNRRNPPGVLLKVVSYGKGLTFVPIHRDRDF